MQTKTLSGAAIARLRIGRWHKDKDDRLLEFAVDAACRELGVEPPDVEAGDNDNWNRAIAAIDEACPDWRGETAVYEDLAA